MWDLCGGVRDSEQAGSVVLAQGLSRPVARGILVPQLGIKPTPLLQGRFLTHGPPGKSQGELFLPSKTQKLLANGKLIFNELAFQHIEHILASWFWVK